jgi:broad specificity phosphatase PhoE
MTTVVIVRHAEKATDQGDDPSLTAAGAERAARLAALLERTKPAALFATQWKRTKETVAPLAEKCGAAIVTVEAKATAELAKRILSEHRGQTVVVAAHSNTVNRLIGDLGGPALPDLDDADYDNLFIVTVGGGEARLLPLRFHP